MAYRLYGDGIHDDTAAIQELLDSRKCCIALPAPEKHYLISQTLKIHSDQELRFDRWTGIKLAPQSNCPMIANSDCINGNKNIAVSGGIWDGNNQEQAPNPQMLGEETANHENPDARKRMRIPDDYPVDPGEGKAFAWKGMRPFHPDRYLGLIMRFYHVDRFELSHMTLKNPVTYAVLCGKVSNFTIGHITFDFNEGNPSPNNMDGIHFEGFSRNGRITDLKGNCYDDLLAFNANDVTTMSRYNGPIENIEVDGIFADRCHSAVRLLSFGDAIRNITIRNVYGAYYRYAIGLTHYLADIPRKGFFDNIVLENLYLSKALPLQSDWNSCPDWAPVWVENESVVGSLRITGLHRTEALTPTPNIEIDPTAKIAQLTVEDCSLTNRHPSPMTHLCNKGSIGKLYSKGFLGISAPDAGKVTELDNAGTIGKLHII